MFDSLDDKIRLDENAISTPLQRGIRYAVVALLSLVLFCGVYMGIRMLE